MKRNLTWMGLLVLIAAVALAACTAGGATESTDAAGDITGITWQWMSVDSTSSGGEKTTVPNPENYTLVFNDDGTVTGTADCNSFSGAYTYEEGGAMTISLGPTTAMACPEGSLDSQFLQLLGAVAAGGPASADMLALTGAGGADYMLFSNGGNPPTG